MQDPCTMGGTEVLILEEIKNKISIAIFKDKVSEGIDKELK